MWIWCATLASVIAVSLASLIGLVSLSSNGARVQRAVFVLVGLAVGAMFGDAFIHLLPQAFRSPTDQLATSLYILLGLLIFFLLEKFLLWRHEHVPHAADCIHPVGYMNLVADGLHNLIDGLLIGSSYLVSLPVGLATTIAVLLHEIPQEIGDFGVLLHAGLPRGQPILIRSDRSAYVNRLVELWDLCREVGFHEIHIATMTE